MPQGPTLVVDGKRTTLHYFTSSNEFRQLDSQVAQVKPLAA
jgi:hypothetical protein